MNFHIISAVPNLLDSPFDHSILKRGIDNGLLNVFRYDLRQFGIGHHKQIDDYQYGGGAGMVLMIEPVDRCIKHIKTKFPKIDEIIYLTPDGSPYKQGKANQLSLLNNIILICGHYKGIDQRIRDHFVTMEISIGDYVISGGELAAAIVVDSIARLLPGVMNNETSALTDSFQDNMLAPPVYTRPDEYNSWKVPEVLKSGHDANIEAWREKKALENTKLRRPDLLHD